MEVRGLVLSATVAEFPSVLLAFAWTQSSDVPLNWGTQISLQNLTSASTVLILLSSYLPDQNRAQYCQPPNPALERTERRGVCGSSKLSAAVQLHR